MNSNILSQATEKHTFIFNAPVNTQTVLNMLHQYLRIGQSNNIVPKKVIYPIGDKKIYTDMSLTFGGNVDGKYVSPNDLGVAVEFSSVDERTENFNNHRTPFLTIWKTPYISYETMKYVAKHMSEFGIVKYIIEENDYLVKTSQTKL